MVDSNYKESLIRIAFRPRNTTFRVADATTDRDPEYISNISDLWVGELPRNRFVKAFIDKLRESREISNDEEDHLVEEIDRLYDLQSYPFTALELSQNVDEEQVADVFVRINSQAVQLKQADFILTLMSVFWDEGRKGLEDFCRSARTPTPGQSSAYNHFIQPDPDQLLRVAIGLGFRRGVLRVVYSILRGKDLETERYSDEFREQQFGRLEDAQSRVLNLNNWHQYPSQRFGNFDCAKPIALRVLLGAQSLGRQCSFLQNARAGPVRPLYYIASFTSRAAPPFP